MSCAVQRVCAAAASGSRRSGVPTKNNRSRHQLRIHGGRGAAAGTSPPDLLAAAVPEFPSAVAVRAIATLVRRISARGKRFDPGPRRGADPGEIRISKFETRRKGGESKTQKPDAIWKPEWRLLGIFSVSNLKLSSSLGFRTSSFQP